MRKLIKVVAMALVLSVILILSISSVALASNYDDNVGNPDNFGIGPAPSAGDGESEGPEWDIPIPNGPNG